MLSGVLVTGAGIGVSRVANSFAGTITSSTFLVPFGPLGPVAIHSQIFAPAGIGLPKFAPSTALTC
ncbi:MAG: hypothetical protein ACLP07_01605 [Terracidiphilus sp.]